MARGLRSWRLVSGWPTDLGVSALVSLLCRYLRPAPRPGLPGCWPVEQRGSWGNHADTHRSQRGSLILDGSLFQVDIVSDRDCTRLLCRASLPKLRRCLDDLLAARALRVEIDLEEVKSLDTRAISTIVAAHERFRSRRGQLYIGRCSDGLDRLLESRALRFLRCASA
ncbi:MAG: anti-sigma factor antagonist [Proteobacteria bacterium]|nr:anti-sigma factor antagonist [Pseudomonadota bacterium]